LLVDSESIVNDALLSAWDQPTIPSALQVSRPVFSANDTSGSSPIEHLLSSRIVIEPINMPLDREDELRFTPDWDGLDLNINPGSAQLTVHRKVR
jgi:hypothetical protein